MVNTSSVVGTNDCQSNIWTRSLRVTINALLRVSNVIKSTRNKLECLAKLEKKANEDESQPDKPSQLQRIF